MRAFNRLYTRRIGLLNDRLDDSPFSLTEARILYELAHRDGPTAAEIGRALDLDRAQLSRIVKRFTDSGLVTATACSSHARRRLLALTPAGVAAVRALDHGADAAMGELLAPIGAAGRDRLLAAAATIAALLEPPETMERAIVLRGPRPGDLGWIVHRQTLLYAEEYGWDWTYEALVAEIVAGFVRDFDPALDQAWIAEVDGAIAGSIFLVRGDAPGVAKLRLLYVERAARGLGLGRRLVETCIARARALGYRELRLWTNSVLVSARRIYEAAGFHLVEEAAHHSFGHDLVGQTWTRDL